MVKFVGVQISRIRAGVWVVFFLVPARFYKLGKNFVIDRQIYSNRARTFVSPA